MQQEIVDLKIFRLSNEVQLPTYATPGSAAFDLRLFLDGSAIEAYDERNQQKFLLPQKVEGKEGPLSVPLYPEWRYKLPTGLIFDVPEGYKININIRGGTSLKYGINLANGTGILDWDYIDELFILIQNSSVVTSHLKNGERFAQACLEMKVPVELSEWDIKPSLKTSRNGGFNSTGVQ